MKVQKSIETKLADLAPTFSKVENESHMHNVPPNSETHFKLTVVSESFAGKRMVGRHQLIYRMLDEELRGEVHALAIHAYTPDEWAARDVAPASPPCAGASK